MTQNQLDRNLEARDRATPGARNAYHAQITLQDESELNAALEAIPEIDIYEDEHADEEEPDDPRGWAAQSPEQASHHRGYTSQQNTTDAIAPHSMNARNTETPPVPVQPLRDILEPDGVPTFLHPSGQSYYVSNPYKNPYHGRNAAATPHNNPNEGAHGTD